MNQIQRLELAHWAVKIARRNGATEAGVDIIKSRDVEIACRARKLETLKESTQNSLDLTIYIDGRSSTFTTADLRRSELEKFIAEGAAMTKYLSADPHRVLPDPRHYEGRREMDLKVRDTAYESRTTEQRVAQAREIEDAALGRSDKIISCTAEVSDTLTESVKVRSNGFEGTRVSTSYWAGIEVTVADGNGGRPEGSAWATNRHVGNLPGSEEVAAVGVKRALAQIGATKLDSDRYDIIVENRVGGRLFGTLTRALTGRSLQQKSSYLEGKLGQKIASDKLTWRDDPFIVGGLGSRLYDGEGLATGKRTIIEKGVLKSYFIDSYYGRKLGLAPTGGRGTNSLYALGDRSLEQLVASLDRGLLITGFIGGNANSTTGDFSYGIRGHLVEKGQLVQPVAEMNLSGNAAAFWHKLVETGNDPYPYSTARRPSLLFREVEISGV
ncbi:MAG: TldD/PmbA family protein [bacterium]|nr:TldD/PmbA family protein [bacterium]